MGAPPFKELEERGQAAMAGVRQGRAARDPLIAVCFTSLLLCSERAATTTPQEQVQPLFPLQADLGPQTTISPFPSLFHPTTLSPRNIQTC